jgi:tetratricopeptide (TPR) repeat protein
MLPDNPLVLFASVNARLAAAGIYQEAKRLDLYRSELKEAASDIQALERSIDLPLSIFGVYVYYEELGDTDKALDVARRSLDKSGNSAAALFCACSLYRQEKFVEALQSLDRRRQADMQGDVTRAFVQAELQGRPSLLEEYDSLTHKYPRDDLELQYTNHVVLLAGRKDVAEANYKRWHPPLASSPDWKGFYEATGRFGSGELSEDAYLTKVGTSRHWQCIANYEAGLFRLAEGDRALARDHFEKAVRTHANYWPQWAWSQMFLSRMKKAPDWPKWITKNQPNP